MAGLSRFLRRSEKPVSRASERVTVGLAVLAVATAGTVIVGEVSRLARRRREAEETPTPDNAAQAAGLATLDTVAVARKAYLEAPRHETVLFNILSGFLGSFATVRLLTWAIRGGRSPLGDIVVGDKHIHHFVPGIVMAFGCGGAALVTENEKLEEGLAFGFGAGAGLTFDEAALLLDLRDVYWSREGLLSVQVSLTVSALLSASILGMRMLRRGEEKAEAEDLIPHPGHASDAATA
jgi:hypothetical protein